MAFMKRAFLFVVTNLLIIVMISIVTSVFGIRPYLQESGINYTSLMIFAALWGMGGSFISLLLSKKMARWMMKVKIIDPAKADTRGRDLVQSVHRLARAANLSKMPEVGYYESPEVNAFATGPSKNNSLVAVSTGLLSSMNKNEVEGVLAHEVAHIANGDMVTMTLIQGVVNAFVLFFARIAAFAVANFMRGDSEEGPGLMVQYGMIFLFDMVFGLLGSMVVCWFSRHREFRADAGGAQYAGRDRMIGALQRLQMNSQMVDTSQKAVATLKINGGKPRGLAALLMTHPPLEKRIERLRSGVA